MKSMRFLLIFAALFSCVFTLYGTPEENIQDELSKKRLEYYLNLKSEEFSLTMIPKEKYLLGLIKTVSEELRQRQLEGVPVSQLGIREVMTPADKVSNAYEDELVQITQLLDEIDRLERLAKRKVDMNALNLLNELKTKVKQVIDSQTIELPDNMKSSEEGQQSTKTTSTEEAIENESAPALSADELFEEWKYNRILSFKVKMAEYEYLRTKLLNSATPVQEKRMFQRELKEALMTYSSGDFFLSRFQLHDILDTYTSYRSMSDVLYYAAESSYGLNYFDEALEVYKEIVQYGDDQEYVAKALLKMIYINYTYGEIEQVYELYQALKTHQSFLDTESFGTVTYLVGYSHFRAGNYQRTLDILGNVPSDAGHFYPSLYLSAACYANLGEDELMLTIYHQLANEREKSLKDPVVAQIRNNALLKLGLIYYDRDQNDHAIHFFNQVSQEFEHYDLSIIGKAWSAYQSGRPGEALRNVESLLQYSMASNYSYEAKVLAARSKELLGKKEEAVQDLKEIYNVGKQADQVMQSDVDGLIQNMNDVQGREQSSLDRRDLEIFEEVEQIRRFLQGSSDEPVDAEQASPAKSPALANRIESEINALDALEGRAQEIQDTRLLRDIRQVRGNLIQALEDHTRQSSDKMIEPTDDPLIRRMGMSEYLKYIFSNLLAETLREKGQTGKDVQSAESLIKLAKARNQFELSVRMEVKQEELEDYYGRLNQYEVWLRENFPQEVRLEIDQWTRFSGYGISNINFSRIQETDDRISRISLAIDEIDRVYEQKRKQLDRRIQSLLSDVTKIEEQMHDEAEKKEQREREQFFSREYFERQRVEPLTGDLKEVPDAGGKR